MEQMGLLLNLLFDGLECHYFCFAVIQTDFYGCNLSLSLLESLYRLSQCSSEIAAAGPAGAFVILCCSHCLRGFEMSHIGKIESSEGCVE